MTLLRCSIDQQMVPERAMAGLSIRAHVDLDDAGDCKAGRAGDCVGHVISD